MYYFVFETITVIDVSDKSFHSQLNFEWLFNPQDKKIKENKRK